MIDTTELLAEFLEWCIVEGKISGDYDGKADTAFIGDTYQSLAQDFMNFKFSTNDTERSTPVPPGE